jgi:O-antigen ligase
MFVVWLTVSLTWSEYVAQGLGKILKYWQALAITGVMTQYAAAKPVRLKLFSAYVAGCWLAVLDVVSSYVSQSYYKGLTGRYSTNDPNFVALALVIGIPIAWYGAVCEVRVWKKLLFLSYMPAAIFGIILTGSRGAALALLGAALAFGICASHKARVWLLCFVLVVCLAILYVLPGATVARFMTIPEELQQGSLSSRRIIWKAGAALVAEHPVRGLGAGAGDARLSSLFGKYQVAHNTPLAVALDGGVVGLLLFYGALVCSFVSLLRCPHAERTMLVAVCAAWLVGSYSLSWESHKVTWFLLGLFVTGGATAGRGRRFPEWKRIRFVYDRRSTHAFAADRMFS